MLHLRGLDTIARSFTEKNVFKSIHALLLYSVHAPAENPYICTRPWFSFENGAGLLLWHCRLHHFQTVSWFYWLTPDVIKDYCKRRLIHKVVVNSRTNAERLILNPEKDRVLSRYGSPCEKTISILRLESQGEPRPENSKSQCNASSGIIPDDQVCKITLPTWYAK